MTQPNETMKQPFVVNVAKIDSTVGAKAEISVAGPIEGLQTSGSKVSSDDQVTFEGRLESIDGGIVAKGKVSATWSGECRRCLGVARGVVTSKVRELFESRPTEGETYELKGHEVDLEPMVRDAVMLELPVAPVCKSDCKGLCSECGANLNEGDCGCDREVSDPRWAALDALKTSDDSDA